jgi:hypothetical protein
MNRDNRNKDMPKLKIADSNINKEKTSIIKTATHFLKNSPTVIKKNIVDLYDSILLNTATANNPTVTLYTKKIDKLLQRQKDLVIGTSEWTREGINSLSDLKEIQTDGLAKLIGIKVFIANLPDSRNKKYLKKYIDKAIKEFDQFSEKTISDVKEEKRNFILKGP